MKKQTTSNRLKQIMSDRNLRQVDILEMCKPYCNKYDIKLGRNDLSQYVTGKVEPGQKKLTVLGMALNVSEAWLMGFDVPMERMAFKDVPKNFHSSFDSVNDFKIVYDKSKLHGNRLLNSIIENAEQLNNDNRKSLYEYSQNLLSNQRMEEALQADAAQARTDITISKGTDTSDDDIMSAEDF